MLTLVYAQDQAGGIGYQNQLPWHLPNDLKFFKQVTLGHAILMGRKTFESIGRPLPKRTNIVLSRQPFEHDGVIWKDSLESAVDFVRGSEEIMLIGGGQLFNEYLSQADRLYLTEIQTELDGDTFFPSINWDEWHIEFEQYRPADEQNPYDCRFLILLKKK